MVAGTQGAVKGQFRGCLFLMFTYGGVRGSTSGQGVGFCRYDCHAGNISFSSEGGKSITAIGEKGGALAGVIVPPMELSSI